MKVFITLIILSISQILLAQQADTINISSEKNKTVFTQQNFMQRYKLEGKKVMYAKVLNNYNMLSEPKISSEKTGFIVPKDSIVYIYKFFPEEKFWAARYHTSWGFLPETEIFPISKLPTNIKISQCEVPPKLKTKIKPIYPEDAKKSKIEGSVVIRIFIDKNGVVTKTSIKKGIQELNNAAIEAVKKAKFSPAKYKGNKVGVWVPMKINFKL